ncbi:MAG: hypothetical protein OYM47_15750 [Gemmatimonadota bacterium]|nr:hypothetical protein [Gemmatimonadota bacterium]
MKFAALDVDLNQLRLWKLTGPKKLLSPKNVGFNGGLLTCPDSFDFSHAFANRSTQQSDWIAVPVISLCDLILHESAIRDPKDVKDVALLSKVCTARDWLVSKSQIPRKNASGGLTFAGRETPPTHHQRPLYLPGLSRQKRIAETGPYNTTGRVIR